MRRLAAPLWIVGFLPALTAAKCTDDGPVITDNTCERPAQWPADYDYLGTVGDDGCGSNKRCYQRAGADAGTCEVDGPGCLPPGLPPYDLPYLGRSPHCPTPQSCWMRVGQSNGTCVNDLPGTGGAGSGGAPTGGRAGTGAMGGGGAGGDGGGADTGGAGGTPPSGGASSGGSASGGGPSSGGSTSGGGPSSGGASPGGAGGADGSAGAGTGGGACGASCGGTGSGPRLLVRGDAFVLATSATSGTLYGWGSDHRGQLGRGAAWDGANQWTPVPVAIEAVSLFAGSTGVCALAADGGVSCWGANASGELGQGTSDLQGHATPLAVTSASPAQRLAGGSDFRCALGVGGENRCWGTDPGLMLGYDITLTGAVDPVCVWGRCQPTPASHPSLEGVSDIATSDNGGCSIVSGVVTCWSFVDALEPTELPLVSDAVQVAVSNFGACARREGGTVTCFATASTGASTGLFGDGTYPDATDLMVGHEVPGLTNVTDVQLGTNYGVACALDALDDLYCWGWDPQGEAGVDPATAPMCAGGLTQCVPAPTRILREVMQFSIGRGDGVCARQLDGQVSCWGAGAFGQLGSLASAAATSVPTPIALP